MSAKTLPAIDMYCPINSLPLAFRTTLDTIPPPVSLSPPLDRMKVWEERLGAHDRLRVGLVWSGNPDHKNDHNRSIPLRPFSAMLDVDANFISLQKDPRPADRRCSGTQRYRRPHGASHRFRRDRRADPCLDLVITVDTSVAHLAGTLGCPTWILLPYTPDYRWLLDRDDSPWYPRRVCSGRAHRAATPKPSTESGRTGCDGLGISAASGIAAWLRSRSCQNQI